MTDPPPSSDSHRDIRPRPDRRSATGMPRWVKVFGIVAIVLVLLFVLLHLAGFSPGGHIH